MKKNERMQRKTKKKKKWDLDERSARQNAIDEGLEEGRKEGMKQGMKEGLKEGTKYNVYYFDEVDYKKILDKTHLKDKAEVVKKDDKLYSKRKLVEYLFNGIC